jgi:hypothetical protein
VEDAAATVPASSTKRRIVDERPGIGSLVGSEIPGEDQLAGPKISVMTYTLDGFRR